jgi:transposase
MRKPWKRIKKLRRSGRRRATKGSRPRRPKDLRYEWAYIFGAVCPARDIGAALVLPTVNADMMSRHLAEIGSQVKPGCHAVIVVDGAGWHQTGGKVTLPENISLLHLPPYSPELNPVENVWQYLRQNHLSNIIFKDYEAVLDASCRAWNALIAEPGRIKSIATRAWATVKI